MSKPPALGIGRGKARPEMDNDGKEHILSGYDLRLTYSL